MALIIDWTDRATGINLPAAYARLTGINVDAPSQTIDLAVGIYKDASAREREDGVPLATFHAWPPFGVLLGQTIDVRTAAYEFLKTLPEFAAATDAL